MPNCKHCPLQGKPWTYWFRAHLSTLFCWFLLISYNPKCKIMRVLMWLHHMYSWWYHIYILSTCFLVTPWWSLLVTTPPCSHLWTQLPTRAKDPQWHPRWTQWSRARSSPTALWPHRSPLADALPTHWSYTSHYWCGDPPVWRKQYDNFLKKAAMIRSFEHLFIRSCG